MTSVLFLGLLIGMQHALEADHVAAVASIAARKSSARKIIYHGVAWGTGHALTLVAFAGGAVLLGMGISGELTAWLETGVGLMLVMLGGHLIIRLVQERVHFHQHRHGDGVVHFHAHSHRGEDTPHDARRHEHVHPRRLPVRTLAVGMAHGLAGSAALLVLTASLAVDPIVGLVYVGIFGVGSIIGMALLSVVIAIPIAYTAENLGKALTWINRGLQGVVGATTMALGIWVAVRAVPL